MLLIVFYEFHTLDIIRTWLSSRNFSGCSKSTGMHMSVVMLIFLLFLDKILGGSFEGGTDSARAPPASLWKKARYWQDFLSSRFLLYGQPEIVV